MAILPDVPGLEVYVEVNGRPAEEFYDPNDYSDGPRRMKRYIEAIPGASFQVVSKTTRDFRPDYDSLKIQLLLDGTIRTSHTKDYDVLYNGRGWVDRFKGKLKKMTMVCHSLSLINLLRLTVVQSIPPARFKILTMRVVEENVSTAEVDEYKRSLRYVGELEWSCEPVDLDYTPRQEVDRRSRTQQFYPGQVPSKVAILMKKSQSVGLVVTDLQEPRHLLIPRSLGRAARRQKHRADDPDHMMRTIYGRVRGARGPFPTFTFCYRTQGKHASSFHNVF
jgi:hypothetical protein